MKKNAAGLSHCSLNCDNNRRNAIPEQPTETNDFAALYRRAFEEFGAQALWSSRQLSNPTPEDALAITRSLRVEGNLAARRLAEQIEQACRAAV